MISRSLTGMFICIFALTAASCESCHASWIAKLTMRSGDSVHRDFAAKRTQWEGADVGARFAIGDGLRTGANSTAMLALSDTSRLSVQPNTTLRFLVDGASEHDQSIDVQAGEAIVLVGNQTLQLRTHVGLAILAPGTRAVLARDPQGLSLQVEVGEATFRDSDGNDRRVGPGEQVRLAIGMALLRSGEDKPGAEPSEPQPAAASALVVNVMQDGVRTRVRGGEWRALARGAHNLRPGVGLRLPPNSEVQVDRGPEHASLLGAGEYVLGEAPVLVEAIRGDLQVNAVDEDVELDVPGGRIVAHAVQGGSEARLRIGEREGVLELTRGQASFHGPSGDRELSPGSSYRWTLASDVANERPDDEDAPDYVNLEVQAGESFVVHAPQVPVAVGFDFTKQCKGRGLVELAQPKRRSSGEGHVNILLSAGVRSYSLRCLDTRGPGGVVARGTAQVLADAGTRQLPLRAPMTLVDADGRDYTIYYQNQLPEVRIRWPNPPQVDTYKLELDGAMMSVTSPDHQFESGSLRDGVHHLTFEAAQRRSRTTTVDVRFDNSTATASLTGPVDRGFKVGETVSIEGVALPAWNVSVRDGTIEKVGADRFRGRVVTSAERPDIAVRLAHRRLGTHYYLRRASGSR